MMEQLNICGNPVDYDAGLDYGMLYSEGDGTRSYAGFQPDSLEDTARSLGGSDETITTLAMLLRKMLENLGEGEPTDEEWEKNIKHTTEGGKPKSEKNKALARTRGLLKKAIKAVKKAKSAKSGKK